MSRSITYIGIDLGGARGKTTAVARLTAEIASTDGSPGHEGDEGLARVPRAADGSLPRARAADGSLPRATDGSLPRAVVEQVRTRQGVGQPWTDRALIDYLGSFDDRPLIAINAPLTVPACVRCQLSVCPGELECVDPAVVWLRTNGAQMVERAVASDLDRIAAIPATTGFVSHPVVHSSGRRPTLVPYVHRISEVVLHYKYGSIPRDLMGKATGPIAARAGQLRRRLQPLGYTLNENLLEVSPRATVHTLFGADKARGYKRDGDPWETRASIVEGLDLVFARSSRLSREEVLRNDHCFEAMLSAYSGFLRQRDGWQKPTDADSTLWDTDGLVWSSDGL